MTAGSLGGADEELEALEFFVVPLWQALFMRAGSFCACLRLSCPVPSAHSQSPGITCR